MKLERKEDESFGNLFNAAEVGWLELIVLKYNEGIKRKTLSRFFNEQRETTASIPSKNYSNVRFYDRVPKRGEGFLRNRYIIATSLRLSLGIS